MSLDVDRLDDTVLDELAASVDDGLALWPGVVPVVRPAAPPSDRDLADRLERLCRRLDQDPARVSAGMVVTPACGLAGADPDWARRACALARATARAFADSVGADQ